MAAEDQSTPAVESGLVDLSGVSLAALRSMDDSAVAGSLEALLHHIDDRPVTMSGFNPSRFD